MMFIKFSTRIVKFMALLSGVYDLRRGKYDHIIENVLNLRYYSSLLPQKQEKTWMHDYDVHEVIYLSCEIHAPWVMGVGSLVGPK